MIAARPFHLIRIAAAAAFFLLAQRIPFAFQAQVPLPKEANSAVQLMLGWEKQSAAGAKVEARELRRTPGEEGTGVAYRFVVTGVPADQLYTLMVWEPGTDTGEVPIGYSLRLTPNGLICGMEGNCTPTCVAGMNCGILNEPLDPVIVAAKGERRFLSLVSNDGKSRVSFFVTPFPITAAAQGCNLNVIRAARSSLAVIQGDGFAPAEDLDISNSSYGEPHSSVVRTDSQGHFDFAVLPFVAGKRNGVTRLTAKGKRCAPSVQFEWGVDAMKLQ
ncbi:MAG: hypothetical protein HYX28_09285 [Candidatus Koribacter versatilis]|uniref:Uncharacterized protein n=1 Tax=Candidatus Korobacter versatilis TaxID=658062 RepID=A0A932A955_9BACT|nr:hypothetical protein [Candidatus Koribacter versatilis]